MNKLEETKTDVKDSTTKTDVKDSTTKTRKKLKFKNPISHGILYIKAGLNNTILSLSDLSGNVVVQVSSGTCGFKHCRKSTPHAIQVVIKTMMNKIVERNVKSLNIVITGKGAARDAFIFILQAYSSYFSVESISDMVSVAYNGVRQRRARRN